MRAVGTALLAQVGMTEPARVGMTEPARVGMTEPAQVGTTEPQPLKWCPKRSESDRERLQPEWYVRRGAWPALCRAGIEACLRDRS
jgi:hypothetical protein